DNERHATVSLLAQWHRQRNTAEHRHIELVCQLVTATLAEDREALARGRCEARHVLDDASDLEVDLVCHVCRASSDLLCSCLRCRHDQEASLRKKLGK